VHYIPIKNHFATDPFLKNRAKCLLDRPQVSDFGLVAQKRVEIGEVLLSEIKGENISENTLDAFKFL
jgi:hypothetical protein